MNKTALVMLQEISSTLRRKTFVIFAFVLPAVVGLVALILIGNGGSDPDDSSTPVERQAQGYVDPAGLIEELPPDIPQDFFLSYPDPDAAMAAMEAGTIEAYYVISADYLETGEILIVTEELNPLDGGFNSDFIEWVLFYNAVEGGSDQAARIWFPMQVDERRLTPPESSGEETWITVLLPNLMALLLYMVVIISASVLVQSVTDEKKNRVLEIMLSSISSQQMITGKILGVGILGLMMMVAWLAVLVLVIARGGSALSIPLDFELPTGLIAWSVVYGFLGYGMYGAQMAALGALVPDLKDSRGATFIVLLPFIVVYVFLTFIVANPDGPLALFFSLFPLTAPVGMISRMAAMDVPIWQAILSAVLQFLTVVLIIRLTGRLFRAQILLSGQPFSVRRYYGLMFNRSSPR